MPIAIAWSTPGAALLVSTGAVAGGWPAAVGAFLVGALLLALAAAWRPLGRADRRDPAARWPTRCSPASCCRSASRPCRRWSTLPDLAAPVIVAWALLTAVARRWAVPGALAVAAIVIVVDPDVALGAGARPRCRS